MKISIPKELAPLEQRVALVPDSVARLVKQGHEIRVETGAGQRASFADAAYQAAGAQIVSDPAALFGGADLVLKVGAPLCGPGAARDEVSMLRPGSALIGFLEPLMRPEVAAALAARCITSFSMELVPRTTRAQNMDALSSMATVAGYKAALLGASTLPRFFPMLVTAAGTISPARVLVLGAGVAGLQAIATTRRLGAVVEAYDVRPAVKEEIESLGATFVELDLGATDTQDAGGYAKELSGDTHQRELQLLAPVVARADLVITTARIPGVPAPILITEEMVKAMKYGSVIVDLAADTGGNCALTRAGEVVEVNGIKIHGPVNIVAQLPIHASQMYSKNVMSFLGLLIKDGVMTLDFEDDILKSSCVTHGGKIVHQRTRERVEGATQPVSAGGK